MRLFISINFEEKVKDKIVSIIDTIKPFSSYGRFSHRDHIHLTLLFLGDIPSHKINTICKTMDSIKASPFIIKVDKIGNFKRDDGDIYWLGMENNESLLKLQKNLNDALMGENFSLEKRKYTPHITIGRKVKIKEEYVNDKALQSIDSFDISAEVFHLMKSENIDKRLIHSVLHSTVLR